MSTLAEIENAAEALSVEQKQELFLFLAARLGGETCAHSSQKDLRLPAGAYPPRGTQDAKQRRLPGLRAFRGTREPPLLRLIR
jgi:hypothetical protein